MVGLGSGRWVKLGAVVVAATVVWVSGCRVSGAAVVWDTGAAVVAADAGLVTAGCV